MTLVHWFFNDFDWTPTLNPSAVGKQDLFHIFIQFQSTDMQNLSFNQMM